MRGDHALRGGYEKPIGSTCQSGHRARAGMTAGTLFRVGTEIKLNWQNTLPLEGHPLPVDTTLHWAESGKKPLEDGYVPTVTHLLASIY